VSGQKLKKQLKKQYGTLRRAARQLGLSPWRLSSVLNGWFDFTADELAIINQHLKNN
jgi:hypothetical protein